MAPCSGAVSLYEEHMTDQPAEENPPSKTPLEILIEKGINVHLHQAKKKEGDEDAYSRWKLAKLVIERVSTILVAVIGAWAGAYFVADQKASEATRPLREQVTDQAAELLILTKAEELYKRRFEEEIARKKAQLGLTPEEARGAPIDLDSHEVSQVREQVQEDLTRELEDTLAPLEEQRTFGAGGGRAEATRKVTAKLDKWIEEGRGRQAREDVLQEQLQEQRELSPR